MKNIITSISDFEEIIKNDAVYVDKTDILYSLISKGPGMFFCSRPRRFGKTLALSTLDAIFRGRKELFRGLKIYEADYDWKEYPVIHIDLGSIQASDAEELGSKLLFLLDDIIAQYSIRIDMTEFYDINFKRIICRLAEKEKVVILIDEYDKILSSNIYNPKAEEMRDVLRGFFEVIKAQSRYIRFAFITGVTKFAKVSIFSSMNNLNDISLDEEYAALFGYTEEELEHYFGEYIERGMKAAGLSRRSYLERIKAKYDGHRFAPRQAETVYNPVSVGTFFFNGGMDFDNYWVNTGTMKLLMDVARKVRFNIAEDASKAISKDSIAVFDILDMAKKDISLTAYRSLLYQTGYLTITGIADSAGKVLSLDFPNEEVAEAYSESLLGLYAGEDAAECFRISGIIEQFSRGKTEEAIEIIRSVYEAIPYDLSKNADELYYSTVFFSVLKALGAEIETKRGRADAILRAGDHVYVIEFKYDGTAEEALEQIKEKGYAEQFIPERATKMIHLAGINFSSAERNINEWKEEML